MSLTNEIIIDTKEPPSIYAEFLTQWSIEPKFAPFTILNQNLPCGDFMFRSLGAERKELGDAIASIHSARIFKQEFKMYHNFEIKYLLIHGNLSKYAEKDLKGLYTTMADARFRYGFESVIFPNVELLIRHFLMMCLKQSRNLKPKWRWTMPVIGIEDELPCMLEGVYGMGPKTARKYLRAFGSMANIVKQTEMGLRSVKGVPAKLAEHLHAVLHTEYQGESQNETEN